MVRLFLIRVRDKRKGKEEGYSERKGRSVTVEGGTSKGVLELQNVHTYVDVCMEEVCQIRR
jgi:hypothetical protein